VWLGFIGVPSLTTWRKRANFSIALAADSGNVDALIGSAATHAVEAAMSPAADPFATFAAAETKLTTALSLAPNHPHGHMWLGLVDVWTKRAVEGIARCEHALELDRNLANAHALIGHGKLFVGDMEETESHIAEALRLSPRDPAAFAWMSYARMSKNIPGSCEQAVAWFRRSIEASGNFPQPYGAISRGCRFRVGKTTRVTLPPEPYPERLSRDLLAMTFQSNAASEGPRRENVATAVQWWQA
jgi:tetratricopeptide (TPR) repeat protein